MSIASQNERGGAIAGLFVKRPVLAIVINALIVVAGLAALFGIEVRELPSTERPVISVSTQFPGAAAETVDRELTAEIEGAVARVQGVTSISSSSSFGSSRVTLSFGEDTDLDTATSDVRDAISRLRRLPDGAETPMIIKADPNAGAIMQLAVTSRTMAGDDLTAFVEEVIVERIASVPGVADVQMYGSRSKSFEVDIDPVKLASLGLSVADVRNALSTVSFDAPAGSINGTNQNINVRALSEVTTPEQFEEIIIGNKARLRDVATVVFAAGSSSSGLRSDGKPGIGIGIVRQAQSNTVAISEAVRAAVADLQGVLPPGVELIVSSDDAIFIGGALHEVERSLIVAVVAVVAIIFLFLMDWRATIIPAITMPVALIGTIAGMYALGFSINILTLLGIVLATGLVVDDAIVVLENIVRQRHLGMGKRAAAMLGTREVFFAVMATTVTLAAVFIPLSFLPGQTGRLFREFGWTLAIAVGLSSVVALSLAPMLASRILSDSVGQSHRNPLAAVGRALGGLYRVTLSLALRNPLVVVLAAVLFAGSAWFVFGTLRQELVPSEDRSYINMRISAPQTVSLDFTRTQMQKIEDLVQPYVESGEVIRIFSISGWGSSTSSGNLSLTLAPWDERTRSQQEIAAEISTLVQSVPGVRVSIGGGNSLNIRGGGSGLQFAVVGPDYDILAETAQAIANVLEEDERFGRVNVGHNATQPQLTLAIDREKAGTLGIDINGLASTMQAMIDGANIGTVFLNDASFSVQLVSTTSPVNDPRDLESIFLRTGDGRYVPMSTIATLSEAPIAPSLGREEQRRAVGVSASLDGFAMGDAWTLTQQIAAPLLPEGTSIIPLAEARTIGDANYGLAITFGFALIVILLVLAAQFESVWSAVIVMATVPFGLACAVYALFITGQSLNVFSQIGLILVVGIMAKNGILIVEFANQLRDRGLSVAEAIEEASNIRLRPVTMTMIATIIGGVPLVLATGAGAESRAALGWVIVGGLGFAAISTLYLTPVAYLLLARFSRPKVEEERRLERELAAAGEKPSPAE